MINSAAVPATDVKGLIAFAKTQPDGLDYATAGAGSLGHLATELFARTAGIKLVHVPYKGQAPSTMAVITGEVKMLLTTSSDTMDASVKSGKLRLLGVSTAQPSPIVPSAPTIGASLPGFEVNVWFGILAPAGTPPEIVAKLNAAIREVLAQPDVQERFIGYGCIATPSTPAELGAMIASEVPKWKSIVETAK